jgi:glycoprotein-N-acetylgalactosamine 3-beta-galactosyltransferase
MKKIYFSICIYCIISMLISYYLYYSEKYLTNKKNPTIFCLIITTADNLNSHAEQIYDSWAHKCDQHRFITLIPGNNKSEIWEEKYKNKLNLLKPDGFIIDKYNLLSHKMFRMFMDVYKYYNKYDWYLKADDDTFIFYDNLKKFLADKNSSEPITFGRDFHMAGGYHSGGAGYLLSHESLKRMASKLIQNYTSCSISGFEDVDVGNCWRSANVTWSKSLDEFNKERFFPQPILHFYFGLKDIDWLHSYGANKLFRVGI